MGVSRARAVKRRKKKDVETALKWMIYPPAVTGALLFGKKRSSSSSSNRSKKK